MNTAATLRGAVAAGIQADQEAGGAGIMTDDEVAAIEWAIISAAKARLDGDPEGEHHRDTLCMLLHELGPRRMSIHGAEDRRDPYWLRCADVAIAAYDRWFEQRTEAQRART